MLRPQGRAASSSAAPGEAIMRLISSVYLLAMVASVGAATAQDAPPQWKMGLRLQGWYQTVEGAAPDGGSSSDFMVRRAYFYVTGKVVPTVSVFAHIAADRVGQAGLDNPGLGLGSGTASEFVTRQPVARQAATRRQGRRRHERQPERREHGRLSSPRRCAL